MVNLLVDQRGRWLAPCSHTRVGQMNPTQHVCRHSPTLLDTKFIAFILQSAAARNCLFLSLLLQLIHFLCSSQPHGMHGLDYLHFSELKKEKRQSGYYFSQSSQENILSLVPGSVRQYTHESLELCSGCLNLRHFPGVLSGIAIQTTKRVDHNSLLPSQTGSPDCTFAPCRLCLYSFLVWLDI